MQLFHDRMSFDTYWSPGRIKRPLTGVTLPLEDQVVVVLQTSWDVEEASPPLQPPRPSGM